MGRYLVIVADEYDFIKADDTIAAARAWARRAFPNKRVTVSREYRFCDRCQSAPCGCRKAVR